MKKNIFILTAVFITVLLSSCTSIKEIPEDKTSAQIIQMGQNAISASDFNTALFCYETVLERYGNNPAVFVEAKYEQGHTYLKQKKYDKAYEIFNSILALYDYNAAVFPPAYKKLANIGINQIPPKKLEALKKKSAENQ